MTRMGHVQQARPKASRLYGDFTIDNVEQKLGPLTGDLASRILFARHSPLAGYGYALVEIFSRANVSAWIGLVMIAQEASSGVVWFHDHGPQKGEPGIDERNIANPFSVHLNNSKDWSDKCKKNLLLKPDVNGTYDQPPRTYKGEPVDCSTKSYRLPSFGEAASIAAQTIRDKGLDHYSETPGYRHTLSETLGDILRGQHDIIFSSKK